MNDTPSVLAACIRLTSQARLFIKESGKDFLCTECSILWSRIREAEDAIEAELKRLESK